MSVIRRHLIQHFNRSINQLSVEKLSLTSHTYTADSKTVLRIVYLYLLKKNSRRVQGDAELTSDLGRRRGLLASLPKKGEW